MIEIYGSPVSNCYNTVLSALRYKELRYTEIHIGASQTPEFLALSPMGKIPYIAHDGVAISETSAIVDYLEEVFPGEPSLFPGRSLQRARQRQLMKFVELYIESPARRLFPGVFWCQENDPLHVREVEGIMQRGLKAVDVLLENNPSLFELPLSAADFYSYFSLALAGLTAEKQYNWSLQQAYPRIAAYLERSHQQGFIQEIVVQRDGAMQAYLDKKAQEAKALQVEADKIKAQ